MSSRTKYRQKELVDSVDVPVTIIYECEIQKMVENSVPMQQHFTKYQQAEKFKGPLDPREAMYGRSMENGHRLF